MLVYVTIPFGCHYRSPFVPAGPVRVLFVVLGLVLDKRDFFISYNKADKEKAEWIAWILEEAEYSTVIQAWDFRPGQDFVDLMQTAILQCERTIAVLSPEYMKAEYCSAEWHAIFAKDPDGKEGLLIPVRVRDCKPEGLLAARIYIDFVGLDRDQAKDALLNGVNACRAKPESEPQYTSTCAQPQPRSRDPRLTAYLNCIIEEYGHWEDEYTQTGAKIDLRVRKSRAPEKPDRVGETDQQIREATQSYPVLEGLEKYAFEHVLLKGVPGSGKTTALELLLLQAAKSALEDLDAPVPVFVRLRSYEDSVEGLIRDFFIQHNSGPLSEDEIQDLLFGRRLFLLADGLNEVPSSDSRKDLKRFRDLYASYAPMVFTTREIGMGSDLGIVNILEMEPLTEAQVKEFVRKKVGIGSERLLNQLADRWEKFAETPLFLEMLCNVFNPEDDRGLPPNLALTFREYTDRRVRETCDNTQVCQEFERYTQEFLAHVAYRMMLHDDPREMSLDVRRRDVEEIVGDLLSKEGHRSPKETTVDLVNEWLSHHLLRLTADTVASSQHRQKIEFSHQLFQEYYAAEHLLNMIDEIESDDLARNYLNYTKWTEPFALLMGLVDDRDTAVRIVKAGLDVDMFLAARLAGEARKDFHEDTVGFILGLQVQEELLIALLGVTGSSAAVGRLEEGLRSPIGERRQGAARALGKIKCEESVQALESALGDEDQIVRISAADALGAIGSEKATDELIRALRAEAEYVRSSAAEALGRIGSDKAVDALIHALGDEEKYVRSSAARALGTIGSEKATDELIRALGDEEVDVRGLAAEELGKIGSEKASDALIRALGDEEVDVRGFAARALGDIGSEKATDDLIRALGAEDWGVRSSAAWALGKIGSDRATDDLIRALGDKDRYVRRSAARALGDIGSEKAVDELIRALGDKDESVRSSAAKALGKIDPGTALPILLERLAGKNALDYAHGLRTAQQKLKIYNPNLLPKEDRDNRK